jgi:hypothetical protein
MLQIVIEAKRGMEVFSEAFKNNHMWVHNAIGASKNKFFNFSIKEAQFDVGFKLAVKTDMHLRLE